MMFGWVVLFLYRERAAGSFHNISALIIKNFSVYDCRFLVILPLKITRVIYPRNLSFPCFHDYSSSRNKENQPILRWYENIYLFGLIVLEIYNLFIHTALGLAVKFPFLPLLLTSVYCAVGILWSWLLFYHSVLTEDGYSKVATD